MSNEWDILSKVYSLLKDENVLDTPATEPIVRFEHPEKLKVSNLVKIISNTSF